MADTLVDLTMSRAPTAERPLLGVMVLVVEDSRYSCDAIRLICQRSGARIRRAESLASATRHLRAYRPRVVIIDLGLPDGSGLTLIRQLARADPRIDVIIAMSGDDALSQDAMVAGADIFISKPLDSVSSFQSTVLGLLPKDSRPAHVAIPLEDTVEPDPVALRDDLALVAELLSASPNLEVLGYITTLLRSVARESGDNGLEQLAQDMTKIDPDNSRAPLELAATIRQRCLAQATLG